MKLIDLAGRRFGRLAVLHRGPARRDAAWVCVCDCGTEKVVRGQHLKRGLIESCGCLHRERTSEARSGPPPEPIAGEEWRDVPGAPGYRVSNMGRVTGLAGGLLRGWLDKNGYPMVGIVRPGQTGRSEWVHQLVAAAFIGPRPEGCEIDHIDRDRTNARPQNLRYVTHAENVANATPTQGERHANARLTETQVLEIRAVPPAPRWGRRGKGIHPNSVTAIAGRYGVSVTAVQQIRRGQRWAHLPLTPPATPSEHTYSPEHELPLDRVDADDG